MDTLLNIIEQALRAHQPYVEVGSSTTENDVYVAIRQLMRDNPDIFWFSHQWHYSQSEAIVRFRYAIDKERSEKIKKQIKDVVENKFKLNSARNLSAREQVMYVYKWIALYCNYDIHSAHNQTIYSVFVHRHSVCTGIAKAAQYLLELLGVESRLVFGKLNNSEEDSRHCWLVINLENKWYHLDPAFALPETEHLLLQCGEKPIRGEDNLFYNFFCVDTDSIKHSRTIEEEDMLPECNESVDCNYPNQVLIEGTDSIKHSRTIEEEDMLPECNESADCNYPNQVLMEGTELKNVAKNAQNETLCYTCADNPSVIVSNEEVEDIDSDSQFNGFSCNEYVDDSINPDDNIVLGSQIDDFESCDYASQINDFATTCGGRWDDNCELTEFEKDSIPETFYPRRYHFQTKQQASPVCVPSSPPKNFFIRIIELFQNNIKPDTYNLLEEKVYSSVFAPAEIAPKQHLMVQVYLHLPEETEKVKSLASEADKNAERRGYEPLEVPLKKGDNVEIELNVNGDSLLYNCRKSVVWQGSFVKRAFDFIVPSDINTTELSCSVNVFVNGAIAGELIFLTAIVDSPRRLNTNVCARPTKKLFISYSHKDIASAEKIAKIHEALGIDVFFDKHRLKAGYIYSEEISNFIQTADTFVLCWSENAAKSDYVEKERQEALSLAYPQYKPRELARLRIHPYNIEPHAVPPEDMIKDYHFQEL